MGTVTCARCGSFVQSVKMQGDTCISCIRSAEDQASRHQAAAQAAQRELELAAAAQSHADAMARIILTTETAHNLPVDQRLEIVTAEVVIGMHLFKDIASAFRDTFGGRSGTMQKGLRDARKTALEELKLEAHALGADAVVGIDLDYSEISGGGKSMLFLVASGTAVTLSKAASGQESVVGSPSAHPDSYKI